MTKNVLRAALVTILAMMPLYATLAILRVEAPQDLTLLMLFFLGGVSVVIFVAVFGGIRHSL